MVSSTQDFSPQMDAGARDTRLVQWKAALGL